MFMKKIVLVLAPAAVLISGAAFAQPYPSHRGPEARVERPDTRIERRDVRNERPDVRIERRDERTGRRDVRMERPDVRIEHRHERSERYDRNPRRFEPQERPGRRHWATGQRFEWKKHHHREIHARDYRRYRLKEPPRGHRWVEVDGRFLMINVATGLIASMLMMH